ncbi:MAG TPA: glycosyltransferase family 9 protein, partial [Opitutaceae bacterium]|nr:glycosyltransferase family 9 protein [Opitutaceae bacterium]
MLNQPQSIVSIRPDTIGDLVIYSSALAALRSAWPKARHTVVVRAGYEALAPLFPSWVEWQIAAFNPFRQKPSECRRELDGLLAALERAQPDLILAPTLNRTWLEAAVAAHFPKVRSLALGDSAVDPLFAAALRIDLGVDAAKAFREIVPAQPDLRDWENQHRLVEKTLGASAPRPLPALAVPPAALDAADRILAEKKLRPGQWAAVFAGGLANVAVKAWRPEAFGQVAAWLQKDRKLEPLLLGHESERKMVEAAADAAERAGAKRPGIWLGRDGELPVLAGLLQKARLYFGHDTGAMHIATAVGCPSVGIFGGGHWPRFRAAGRQVASLVQPLPCFGCNWDCEFGDGPCVKAIPEAEARRAIAHALDRAAEPFDEVVEVRGLPEEALALIRAVTPRYRALQADRLERQHRIEDFKAETNLKDREIAEIKASAEERKAESDAKDGEIIGLKAAAEERKAESEAKDREIRDLKDETNTKDREIAEIKASAEERKAESDAKDGEIAELKGVCNEREALIIQQDKH